MVKEVKRQFRERPGILKGIEKLDYCRVVNISTPTRIKEHDNTHIIK
jgi:Na+/H+-translocating membrane pyrophosphatase